MRLADRATGAAGLLCCAVLLSACGSAPAPHENVATVIDEEPQAWRVGNRMRYAARSQPVVVAPDGSRRRIASMLVLPHRMEFGDFLWDDDGARNNTRDGAIWVRVDLARQLISVFRGENEIGTAVILYGSDGKATPTGVFPVLGKERMHRSLAYDADMPYTMWLTDDGVAIHASSIVSGRATHGCVGIPEDFASKLFAVARRGDVAIVLPASATS